MAQAQVFSMDDFVRYEKGVPGFLELFTTMNRDQRGTFDPILAPARPVLDDNARLMFANILDASKFATASEIKVRENERLLKLNRVTLANTFDISASIFNEEAVRYAQRALTHVCEIRKRLPINTTQGVFELQNIHEMPDFPDSLTEAREAFLNSALQLNFTNNDEFEETLSIWDNTMALAKEKGVHGILDNMETNLLELIKIRKTEERGTSPASPLPWWKFVIIGVYIGAAAFAIFACFYWSGCAWVWDAIAKTAPWIFKIVEMGC